VSIVLVALIVLLLVVVIAIVSAPLRSAASNGRNRADSERSEPRGDGRGRREREALAAELAAAREAKYQEIRDAELDYRTGKLSREDFEAVDATLRAEAIEILNRIAELEGGG
jgi:hypothetical protein